MPHIHDEFGPSVGDIAFGESEETERNAEPVPEPEAWWKRILTAETGPGPVSDYRDHPLNPGASVGCAHVLRGLTGIFGSLNLALADVAVGVVRWVSERGVDRGKETGPS